MDPSYGFEATIAQKNPTTNDHHVQREQDVRAPAREVPSPSGIGGQARRRRNQESTYASVTSIVPTMPWA